ncbi:MAG: hypothetical protein QOC71_596 [Thermoplasmata archaeon]|jgi:hypothetical protein|nr:hypothetical protein [Thermoplasmata archaeon]
MAWRRLAAILLLASAGAIAIAQPQQPAYQPERETLCWDCHSDVPIGNSPPVATFVSLTPPQSAGAAVGTPFLYEVRVQNAWTADVTFNEPELDLSDAPSLAFAADVAPIEWNLPDNLTFDPLRVTEAQAKSNQVPVPVGLTYLRLRLEPGDKDPVTGPDLALRVENNGASVTIDKPVRGGAEELNLTSRSDFSALGYGNWTVSAVAKPVGSDPGDALNFTVAKPTVPFRLVLRAGASDTGERIAGLPSRDLLAKAEGTVATFHLVPLRLPASDETVTLRVRAHVHFVHQPSSNAIDDADLVKEFSEPIHVVDEGGQVRLATVTTEVVAVKVQNGATMSTVAEAVGYASAFLMVASTTAGGMFGKASRRWANGVFGTAKRRVAFHNFLSYGLILAAFAHTTLFVIEAAYGWAVGLVWGGLAALCMLGLGVTGALQVPMIRRWSFPGWRWSHYGLAVATILFTLAHMGLDGAHFSAVQDWLGWDDPVVKALD